jgi:hypothetical protein
LEQVAFVWLTRDDGRFFAATGGHEGAKGMQLVPTFGFSRLMASHTFRRQDGGDLFAKIHSVALRISDGDGGRQEQTQEPLDSSNRPQPECLPDAAIAWHGLIDGRGTEFWKNSWDDLAFDYQSDNSKGAAYNEKADRRSWKAMISFFGEVLK